MSLDASIQSCIAWALLTNRSTHNSSLLHLLNFQNFQVYLLHKTLLQDIKLLRTVIDHNFSRHNDREQKVTQNQFKIKEKPLA